MLRGTTRRASSRTLRSLPHSQATRLDRHAYATRLIDHAMEPEQPGPRAFRWRRHPYFHSQKRTDLGANISERLFWLQERETILARFHRPRRGRSTPDCLFA